MDPPNVVALEQPAPECPRDLGGGLRAELADADVPKVAGEQTQIRVSDREFVEVGEGVVGRSVRLIPAERAAVRIWLALFLVPPEGSMRSD